MNQIIRLTDRTRITTSSEYWLTSILGNEPNEAFKTRFWNKVERKGPDDCWNWKAFLNPKGYGQFQIKNARPAHAHKVALALTTVVLIGEVICHTCDNRKCCNPNHLYRGTWQSNMDDMISRQRAKHPPMLGENNGMATITSSDARYIQRWYKKRPTKDIADYLGCSLNVVRQVGSGKTWKHVE